MASESIDTLSSLPGDPHEDARQMQQEFGELTEDAYDEGDSSYETEEAIEEGERDSRAVDRGEPIRDSNSEGDGADLVDSVQVLVTFEVGEARIALGRLRSLSPGYTFELTTPVAAPVAIKAYGQPIGRGELVRIGDRLGVRLLEEVGHGTR